MKHRTIFILGFLASVFSFVVWQKEILTEFWLSIRSGERVVSPLAKDTDSSKILGEITTLENNFDLGELMSEASVLAQGAFVYDLDRSKAIFEKNSREKLPAASTVKIVTAAVALDRGKLDEEFTVNTFPTVVGESSMNLAYGERFTLEELLYGLLLVSGNDSAETIAQGLAGKREIFVSWMNDFAQKTGAYETVFTTPSGLDEEGQCTTTYDLFLMARYIFERYPQVLQISVTREKYLPKTDGHQAYLLRNKLLLLDSFSILGGKPGLGEDNLLSLVALIKNENRRVLVVLLRTPSLRHDLDQIFKIPKD